jgi:hypothetical protein
MEITHLEVQFIQHHRPRLAAAEVPVTHLAAGQCQPPHRHREDFRFLSGCGRLRVVTAGALSGQRKQIIEVELPGGFPCHPDPGRLQREVIEMNAPAKQRRQLEIEIEPVEGDELATVRIQKGEVFQGDGKAIRIEHGAFQRDLATGRLREPVHDRLAQQR